MISRSYRNCRSSRKRKKRGAAFTRLAVFSCAAAAGILITAVPVIRRRNRKRMFGNG